MIARMSKYDFILFAGQREDFIDRLRELGLVDITTQGWEPSEADRQLVSAVESHAKAIDWLESFREDSERFDAGAAPFATGAEAYERYAETLQTAAALRSELSRLEKIADEARPWGAFSAERLSGLAERGIVLHYFVATTSAYEKQLGEWQARYLVQEIATVETQVYFVVIAAPGEEVSIDAQEVKAPAMTAARAEEERAAAGAKLAALDAEFSRAAVSLGLLKRDYARLREKLQEVKVTATAQEAADGKLLLLEGWAEWETARKVDALLEEYPNVVYLKRDPTPEDDTPVKLKNNRFARIFELVGDMYARPKYGTLDLTPFFAPFYMLFFGICLNDAGYGLILLLMGLFMLRKTRGEMMRRASWFATLCGLATLVFGLFCGSFFGLSMQDWVPLGADGEPLFRFFDFQGRFFSVALAIGVVQILLGLVLKVYTITVTLGFRYALATLGWFLVILSGSLAVGLKMIDPAWSIPGFSASSPAFYGVLGIAGILMFFFNSPGKNPLINLGSGLWDTYNNITGILSDVLSYIRLFAIGLSGGILAMVFNDLANGFVPEGSGIVVRLLVMIPILLIGHGINLFMSTISSFVHPMRLTFVEFYKNAGFEMASRSFDPLRKLDSTETNNK